MLDSLLKVAEALTPDELETQLAEDCFSEFVKQAWPILEPATPYLHNWHLDAMAEHLQALTDGQLRKLIINIPPGSAKSLLVSVMWPAWHWLRFPADRFLTASHTDALSIRDALKSRRLIDSLWYQARWSDRFQLTGDQNQKSKYENDKTGFRLATHVGGATGERAKIRVLDDPHEIEEAESDKIRESTIDWVRSTWAERESDPRTSIDVLVMQRLHERDVSGFLLDEVGGFEHLMIPMEYEPSRRFVTSVWPGGDPRKTEGELLFPDRWNAEEVATKKRRLGSYKAAGQLQQRPSPDEGGILKRHWWRYWHYPNHPLPPVVVKTSDGHVSIPCVELPYHFDQYVQSWDMSFKGNDTNDFVVGGQLARLGANTFHFDLVRDRQDFVGTIRMVKAFNETWSVPGPKLVEDKANGPAIVSALRNEVAGIREYPVQGGDKIARARAYAPQVEAGQFYLPHPQISPWVSGFIEECVGGDTKLLTPSGLKEIRNIREGDQVLTHAGRFRKVQATSVRTVRGVWELQGKSLDPILVTGNHPALSARIGNPRKVTGIEWVPVHDLVARERVLRAARTKPAFEPTNKPHHTLMLPRLKDGLQSSLDLAFHVRHADTNKFLLKVTEDALHIQHVRASRIHRNIPLNYAFGKLLGLYLAEGSTSKGGQIVFSFAAKETDLHEECSQLLHELFGLRSRKRTYPTNKGLSIVTSSSLLAPVFRECGSNASVKHLPEWAWNTSAEFRRGVLDGWIDGDGHIDKNGLRRGSTISETLAWEMRILAIAQGFSAVVSSSQRAPGVIRSRQTKSRQRAFCVSWHTRPRCSSAHILADAIAYSLDEKTFHAEREIQVYNLTVEEDASYFTTAGIFHNCAVFPNGQHDDQVDMWSQAMSKLYEQEPDAVGITPEYHPQFHLLRESREPTKGAQVQSFRFWHDGLHPTCILGQVSPERQIITVLDCVQMANASLEELIDRKVLPILRQSYQGVNNWRDVGNHRQLTVKSSAIEHRMSTIIGEKLGGQLEPGEPDFFQRVTAIKTVLGQTARFFVNSRPSLGESKILVHEALAGGYAYKTDPRTGAVSQGEPRDLHPMTFIGDALGHGLARVFVRRPVAEEPDRTLASEKMKQAKGYAVGGGRR